MLKNLARKLRANQTDAEKLLWRNLRNRQLGGFKFKRQYWIRRYIVDFICLEQKLVVEIDGGQHATEDNAARDRSRTNYLESRGFKVLRFWNTEVLTNPKAVLADSLSALQAAPSVYSAHTTGGKEAYK